MRQNKQRSDLSVLLANSPVEKEHVIGIMPISARSHGRGEGKGGTGIVHVLEAMVSSDPRLQPKNTP